MPGRKPARVEAVAAAAAGSGSRPLLIDPSLQLCLLPEVAQLGYLPRPGAAWLACSPGRKRKPSGQSYCVDPGVWRHRHVKVWMCAFLSPSRTHHKVLLKNAKHKKKTEYNGTTFSESTRDQKDQPIDQRTNDKMFGPVSFCR